MIVGRSRAESSSRVIRQERLPRVRDPGLVSVICLLPSGAAPRGKIVRAKFVKSQRTGLICFPLTLMLLQLFCLFTPAREPAAGIEYQVEIRSVGSGLEVRQHEVIRWWEGRWWENSEDGGLIIDLPGGQMLLIDHQKKSWTGGESVAFLAEMEREIQNLSGKVRKTYLLPSPGTTGGDENPFRSQVRVEKKGRSMVSGHACQHYQIFLGKELCQEVWLDPTILPGQFFPLPQLLPILERFSAVTSTFEKEFRNRDDYLKEMAIQAELRTIFPEGLEIMSRDYRRGELVFEKKTSGIRVWPADPAVFHAPAGYAQVTYREFLEESLPENKEVFGTATDGTE